MAIADDRRTKPGPGPGAGPDEVPGPFTEALRAAIDERGLSSYALAKATGLIDRSIRRFVRRQGDLKLSSADRLFKFFGLGVVRESNGTLENLPGTPSEALRSAIDESGLSFYALEKAVGFGHHYIKRFTSHERTINLSSADRLFKFFGLGVVKGSGGPLPVLKPPVINPIQPVLDALRAALIESRLSYHALAKASDLHPNNVSRFIRGKSGLQLTSVIKLAAVVGIETELAKILARPDMQPPSPAGPIALVARSCPVELRGEGKPIRVNKQEVPPLTGIAYQLAEFAVERFHEGRQCFGPELGILTQTKRPIRILMRKLDQPRFSPLARVLIWDASKGGTLRIIDPGPEG